MLISSLDDVSISNLIDDIEEDNSILDGLSTQLLEQIVDFSVINNDYRALDIIANIHTGIYEYDEKKPEWLDSNFYDKKWLIKINKKTKVIHWDKVYLDDGRKLTDKKHYMLLNSFKYWLTAVSDPLENGGKLIAPSTAVAKINIIITLINAVLLYSKEVKLSKNHLKYVDDNFWINILVKFSEKGNVDGIYDTEKRLRTLLNKVSGSVKDVDCKDFIERFPYVLRDIDENEIELSLDNRAKACFWLFEKGAYYIGKGIFYQGNSSIINKLIYDGKMLYNDIRSKSYPELYLREPKRNTEYCSVDNRNLSTGTSKIVISKYISAIRLLHTNLNKEDTAIPSIISDNVSATSISHLTSVKKLGRTRTLPPRFVFKLIRQCYEFAKEHLSTEKDEANLLEETLHLLEKARCKSVAKNSNHLRPHTKSINWNEELHRNMHSSERGYWFQTEAINYVSSYYLKKGVKQVQCLSIGSEERHIKIRDNVSLFDLFSVLQGSIQILVGVLMARRQDELISLSSHGNLSPNLDPFDHTDINYSLVFRAKKTGSMGVNKIMERPIPLSIAKFVWQLEKFNIKAKELKLSNGKLSLFSNINTMESYIIKVNAKTYNINLDNVCDYMETDLVKYSESEYRRNYVRQHQFRRFFAMAFFWSKGFDGMDSLRWMLGHSDMEHLYHYITESETGAVLQSAKASVIVRGVIDCTSEFAKLEGIEKVRKMIAERMTGDCSLPITLEPVSEASEDYDDESYFTVPHISQIKKEQDIETEVIHLLEEEIVTLEPEFFTISDIDGNDIRTFNLILKIKENQ